MRRIWMASWMCVAACSTGTDDGLPFPPTLSMGPGGAGTSGENADATEASGDQVDTSGDAGGTGPADTGCTETLWWNDVDGDGHGAPGAAVSSCDPPAGHSPIGDDCNDGDPQVHPAQLELCDGKDNDCDGLRDEASDANTNCNGCDMFNFGGHGYAFCPGVATWSGAQSSCGGDFGANLVELNDGPEHDAVAGFAAGTDFWIGASDSDREGTFRWVDGSALAFTRWHGDQPDDYEGEDCVEMRQDFSYQWNDLDCTDPRGFICEIQ